MAVSLPGTAAARDSSALLADEYGVDIRIRVLTALYPQDNFKPQAQCPQCRHSLSAWEILAGFRDDPRDFTTECPECGARFEAVLPGKPREEPRPFMCRCQVIYLLRNVSEASYWALRRSKPGLLQSAVFYFTTVTRAFAEVGKKITDEPPLRWESRVSLLRGEIPDEMIAANIGVPLEAVRSVR